MEEKHNNEPIYYGVYGNIVRWVVLVMVVMLIVGIFGFYIHTLLFGPSLSSVSAYEFALVFGAPFHTFLAFCAALFVVLLLRFSTGPIEFEGLGFKFRGASGPLVLWIFCFLAIVFGLYLLGVGGMHGLH